MTCGKYDKHIRTSEQSWQKLKRAAGESRTQGIGAILDEVMAGKRDPVSMLLK